MTQSDMENMSELHKGFPDGNTIGWRDDEETNERTKLNPIPEESPATIKPIQPWKNIKIRYPTMQMIAKSSSRDDSLCYKVSMKFFRLLCFAICFLVILGSSVMSKLVLTLISAQTVDKKTQEICVKDPNNRFVVETSPVERMAWNWTILFILIIPEILVFLDSSWIIFFKKAKKPSLMTFLVVALGETLHTVGLCLLVFEVIPNLDSIRTLMFLNGFCFVPGLLSLLSRKWTEIRLKWFLDLFCLLGMMTGFILWSLSENQWFFL